MKFAFPLLGSVVLITMLAANSRAQPGVAPPDLPAPIFEVQVVQGVRNAALPLPAVPAVVPATTLNFSNLIAAKIDSAKNPPQIILMIESYRPEVKKIDVMRPVEKKVTQTYTTPNGETAEREVTVTQFVPEKVEQTVATPAGLKPKVMKLADFQIYDIDAKPVEHSDAAKTLEKLQPVFLLEGYLGELQPLSKYERQVLKPDVLIVVTQQIVNEYSQRKWQPLAGPQGFIPVLPAVPPRRVPGVPQIAPIQPADAQHQKP